MIYSTCGGYCLLSLCL